MAGDDSVAVGTHAPERHNAALLDMGFTRRASGFRGTDRYDRAGRYTQQTVLAWHEAMTDAWWFAPRTPQWNPGIKFSTPEAAVAFAEVEQWGRADVQGTV